MLFQHTYSPTSFSSQNWLKNTPVFYSDSSGKEKDSETGYHYFGARYYNSDLSLWLSVDPMSDKYPSLSPYNYCAWNPMKIVDPNGDSVINMHSININRIKGEISTIESRIADCSGSNKTRKLQRELKEKNRLLKKEVEYEQIVDNAINDLKRYGGDEFDLLNNLTDLTENHNTIDVYICVEPSINGVGGPWGQTSGKLSEHSYIPSMVSLNYKGREFAGKTLAHEGGHIIHDVNHPEALWGFYMNNPDVKRNGHDGGNPSGMMADYYENRYEENIRKTRK